MDSWICYYNVRERELFYIYNIINSYKYNIFLKVKFFRMINGNIDFMR